MSIKYHVQAGSDTDKWQIVYEDLDSGTVSIAIKSLTRKYALNLAERLQKAAVTVDSEIKSNRNASGSTKQE